MTYRGNDGSVLLFPTTPKSQIIDANFGEMFGPYQFTLTAAEWSNGQQTVTVDGITSDDIPRCIKVLSGTFDEMIEQDKAYSMLDPVVGIESLDGQVRFTCLSGQIPSVDFTVQVFWFR